MSKAEPQLDHFLLDLKTLITSLTAQHRYYKVHLIGNDGVIRVEVDYQVDSYNLRSKEGSPIVSR